MSSGLGNITVNDYTGSVPGITAGLDANKPATAIFGDWYLSKDIHTLSVWNGAAWVIVLSDGTAGTPTIQQVLLNGNIATGTPPLIFNNGTFILQINPDSISITDISPLSLQLTNEVVLLNNTSTAENSEITAAALSLASNDGSAQVTAVSVNFTAGTMIAQLTAADLTMNSDTGLMTQTADSLIFNNIADATATEVAANNVTILSNPVLGLECDISSLNILFTNIVNGNSATLASDELTLSNTGGSNNSFSVTDQAATFNDTTAGATYTWHATGIVYNSGPNNITWQYDGNGPVTFDTLINWRAIGATQDVAYLSDITGGAETLDQVLTNGNVSARQIILDNTGGSVNTQDPTFSALVAPGGSSVSMTATGGVSVQDGNLPSNICYINIASGVGIVSATTSSDTNIQLVADGVAGFVNLRAKYGGQVFNFTFDNNAAAISNGSADFRTGNHDTVAYLSDFITGPFTVVATGLITSIINIPHGLSFNPRYASFQVPTVAMSQMLNFYGVTWDATNIVLHVNAVLFNVTLTGTFIALK